MAQTLIIITCFLLLAAAAAAPAPATEPSAAMFPDMASTLMAAATATFTAPPPPEITPEDIAAARGLVADAIWGVLSSIDYMAGSPFGNIVSYADGGTGTPYFYLTRLDQKTVLLADANPSSTLAVTQYAVDGCPAPDSSGHLDPQEPLCSRVTLSGRLIRVDPKSAEGVFAGAALLKRHPRFDRLPRVANFELFKLDLNSPVYLINSYIGSPKNISVPAYLNFSSTAF